MLSLANMYTFYFQLYMSTLYLLKITLFGHISRYESLDKMILQDSVEGCRMRVRLKRNWMNNILEWYNLPLPKLQCSIGFYRL